ncbi:MAG: twin-arginine translocase TatA/TatE family subunit [Solirubrobacteraceae bacterium]
MVGFASPAHIALVAVVLLFLFGAKRLPELGRSLGSGMREFKDGISGAAQARHLAAGQVATESARPEAVEHIPVDNDSRGARN